MYVVFATYAGANIPHTLSEVKSFDLILKFIIDTHAKYVYYRNSPT